MLEVLCQVQKLIATNLRFVLFATAKELFPAEDDDVRACENALKCSKAILGIMKKVINPIFKAHELPQISVRIGLTYGIALVVLYGSSLEKAHIVVKKCKC
jgi:uncharacterized membrane protein YvlD (DUF360 family)